MKKEIANNSRDRNDCPESVAEMARIKAQLFRRISKAMRERHATIRLPKDEPRIPLKLLPMGFHGNLIADVSLFKGEILRRLIVNHKGLVVGQEKQSAAKFLTRFATASVYAVRVRSGFLGRMGLTRWRTIFD